MLPKWHIIWGAIFTAVIWIFAPDLNPIYLLLIFLSTFLIDFDHYLVAANKNKHPSLKKALGFFEENNKKEMENHKKGKRIKGHFFLFHTIEFHILVGALGLLWAGFFYIFIGMVFHSLLDLAWLLHHDMFYVREFFFFNWFKRKQFK